MFNPTFTSSSVALCASLFVSVAFAQKPTEPAKVAPKAAPAKASSCKLDNKGTPVKVKLTTSMGLGKTRKTIDLPLAASNIKSDIATFEITKVL